MILTHRNFAVAYLLLVIIPILGFAGVLKSGSKLVAPDAIAGLWKMQVDAPLAALPCARSAAAMWDVGFTISQSGKYFTLSFANSVAPSTSGFIEGTTVKVSILPSAEVVKEAGLDTCSLTATLDSKTNPISMAGFVSVNDCAACSPVEFRAVHEQ